MKNKIFGKGLCEEGLEIRQELEIRTAKTASDIFN